LYTALPNRKAATKMAKMAKMIIILRFMPADFDGAKIRKMIEFSTFLQKKMRF
jgi:hypothetical protein